MKIQNRCRLVYRSIERRRFLTILLFAIHFVSFYMIDEVCFSYFQANYAVYKTKQMFHEDIENVHYISLVGKKEDAASGAMLADYVKHMQEVAYSGYFSEGVISELSEDPITVIICETSLMNMGNLKLDDTEKEKLLHANGAYQQVLLGSDFVHTTKIGEPCSVSLTQENDCVVAGFLKKGAAWPGRGSLFHVRTNGRVYRLDHAAILLTDAYERYDTFRLENVTSEYYYVTKKGQKEVAAEKIRSFATEQGLTVKIQNIADSISEEIRENRVTGNASFPAMLLFVVITMISMTASSIVYCLLHKRDYGILLVCGMKRWEIASLTYIYNGILSVFAAMAAWLIRQREIFGTIFVQVNADDILQENELVGHVQWMPWLLLGMVFVILLVSGMVPTGILFRMKPAQMVLEQK